MKSQFLYKSTGSACTILRQPGLAQSQSVCWFLCQCTKFPLVHTASHLYTDLVCIVYTIKTWGQSQRRINTGKLWQMRLLSLSRLCVTNFNFVKFLSKKCEIKLLLLQKLKAQFLKISFQKVCGWLHEAFDWLNVFFHKS